MRTFFKYFLAAAAFVALVFSAVSCGSGSSRKALLPNVSGRAGEVVVVIEKSDWESALGNSIRELLASDCPWLIPSEPLYSLANVTPAGFGDMFKVHRNIVLCQVDPQIQKAGVEIHSDVWASPQVVVKISAYTTDEACQLVDENKDIITSAIEQAERDRVVNNCIIYEEKEIAQKVETVFGGSPHFPVGYKLRKMTADFAWIAYEKQYSNQTILMYKYPARGDSSDFTEESIIAHRDSVMKMNVPGMFDGTYMTTSQYVIPDVQYMKYKGRSFAQTRGYWEVYNDYMGGPFVSHSFYSQDGKDIIVTEAFVYAPKYDKRQLLRQVESILYSFAWKKEETKD
jgi:hypothetical protein